MSEYEDIINIKYPFESKHPKMSMMARAGQFSAFAALTGYDDAIWEKGRLTDRKIELGEDEMNALDMKLQELESKIDSKPLIIVTYFIKDSKKSGGKYETYHGNLAKIDNIENTIIFTDKKKIKITNIIDINY